MCKRCYKVMTENIDVQDRDLPNMDYTLCHWKCIVCGGGKRIVRDYGAAPMYYWPVKVRYGEGWWHGGWFDSASHFILCSRCWDIHLGKGKTVDWRRFLENLPEEKRDGHYMISLVAPIDSPEKKKKAPQPIKWRDI